MGHRSSNVQRNKWAVELLDVQPTDHVLELGCGPGVAVAALAGRATRGLVVGVDHSEVMIRQARRRNAAAIRQGRVRLIHSPVERLQVTDGPFDAALAVNNVGMWPEPTAQLRDIGRLLRNPPAAESLWSRSPAAQAPPQRRRPRPPTGFAPCFRKQASETRAPNARTEPASGVRPRHSGTCATDLARRRSELHELALPGSARWMLRPADDGGVGQPSKVA